MWAIGIIMLTVAAYWFWQFIFGLEYYIPESFRRGCQKDTYHDFEKVTHLGVYQGHYKCSICGKTYSTHCV